VNDVGKVGRGNSLIKAIVYIDLIAKCDITGLCLGGAPR
jgi:hypothetical protein